MPGANWNGPQMEPSLLRLKKSKTPVIGQRATPRGSSPFFLKILFALFDSRIWGSCDQISATLSARSSSSTLSSMSTCPTHDHTDSKPEPKQRAICHGPKNGPISDLRPLTIRTAAIWSSTEHLTPGFPFLPCSHSNFQNIKAPKNPTRLRKLSYFFYCCR